MYISVFDAVTSLENRGPCTVTGAFPSLRLLRRTYARRPSLTACRTGCTVSRLICESFPRSWYTALPDSLPRHRTSSTQVNGPPIDLTPKEFQILQQFLESPRRVFSRQEMLNRVWGEGYALEEHALDVHIHSLRQKIEVNPANPTFLLTVRGVGYKLQA